MTTFDSGSFSDIAGTPMGRKMWAFLNSDDSRIRLETATYLGRPALEGLQPQLLAAFGEDIRADRWKQAAGRMTRQVMEERGHVFVRSGMKTRVKELFTTAALYESGRGA